MEFLDARRLTGPNLLGNLPGSILDISCHPDEAIQIIKFWEDAIAGAHQILDWPSCKTATLLLSGGISLYFTAPIDRLYAASEINEWAFDVIKAKMQGEAQPDLDPEQIRVTLSDEQNPELIALQLAARDNNVTFLWDDDNASLGLGRYCESWPLTRLPNHSALDYSAFRDVPIGIITGTNGKTTTARVARFILQHAGGSIGMSSTDWIAVNDRIIDRGDWSGPGGARTVLREPDVDCAILETARGGLLRRGLGVEKADTALITNIAEDHLGDFGSRNLDELLDIKWIVSRAVEASGSLILNADDELLVQKASSYPGRIIWFSLQADNAVIQHHTLDGGSAFVSKNGQLIHLDGQQAQPICAVADIPITLGGAARHNIANALAAAALTFEMGCSLDAIRHGLTTIRQEDNPGRCNVYDIGESKVLVDFAHNPHAMSALFDMARALPAKRRLLTFGQAGDRPDGLIQDMTRAAWAIGLERVQVTELPTYYRGRAPGEVYQVIRNELIICGAEPDTIIHYQEEIDALDDALAWAEPGDLIIMLALGERKLIQDRLTQLSRSES